LKEVSIKIKHCEKVSLLGANGSGKTTLIKLLLQLHLPNQGSILVDDKDLTSFNLSEFRKRLGLVSQEVFLFNDTIINNLIYGCSSYSKVELEEIIDRFCSFVYDLPDGLDTMVGEVGRDLSGGQKQAISIVRTLLKHPDVFIFDEGASHLDKTAYSHLEMLIDQYFADKSCVFISHHDEILKKVNRVFLIENNSIHEKKYEDA
jgi:subfamily B ATP-binding cassette protein MsbA